MRSRKILVAPLNWGLGHATRCVPIIQQLLDRGFTPIIASDGAALELLRKEFPDLKSYELPSYNISYTRKGSLLKWKLLKDTPSILKAIKKEKKATKQIVEKENLSGIISDSRFGVRYKHLPSVFITHQLNVLSGNTTFLSSHIHNKYISKYDECWVPDAPKEGNLSGFLGHLKKRKENVKYLGVLSRLQKKELPLIYDYLVLLSGPEPQRTLLEELLLEELQESDKKILVVRGVLNNEQQPQDRDSRPTIRNYLVGKELEDALNVSRVIIARSGYTTLMDLAKLQKKAFLIPTPGQFEQEYLAERMMKLGKAPFCNQKDFKLDLLDQVKNYNGLAASDFVRDFSSLFHLFKSK